MVVMITTWQLWSIHRAVVVLAELLECEWPNDVYGHGCTTGKKHQCQHTHAAHHLCVDSESLFLGSVVFWWNWWNALFILPAIAALCGLFLICSDLWLRNTYLLLYCDVCLTFSEGLMTDKSYSSSSLFVATSQSGMQFNVHHLPVWYLCSQKGMLLLLFSFFEIFVCVTIIHMFKAVEVWLDGNIVRSDEE